MRVLQNSSKIDSNDASVVVYLEYGNFEAIFTGDAESKILSQKGEKIGDIDILKVGHHGSKDAVNDRLLYRIKPEAAIISLGKNSYGHPHVSTIELLGGINLKLQN
jgi:beta-lactamase superfamily II metal-dependent hydrolase